MTFLRALFSPLGRWLAAAAAAVALVFTIRARGYADGKSAEQAKAARIAQEGLREAREIERELKAMPAAEKRDELGKWVRR